MRGAMAFLAGFACVQVGAITTAPRPREPSSGPPHYGEAGVEAPPPSQLTEWSFVLGGSSLARDEWSVLAEQGFGARDAVNGGDAAWVDAVVTLESPFFEVDDRLACAARYGSTVESHCAVRFDIGIQRQSPMEGRVMYARGTLLTENESPTEDAACELFVKCMAHSKLDGIVPVPTAEWSEMVVYQLIGLVPMADDLRVPENLRVQAGWAEDYRRELERKIRENEVDRTPVLEAKILSLEDKARYLRRRADEFEAEEDR